MADHINPSAFALDVAEKAIRQGLAEGPPERAARVTEADIAFAKVLVAEEVDRHLIGPVMQKTMAQMKKMLGLEP